MMASLTQRQMNIAYMLLKHQLKQNLSLKSIASFRREVGNVAKEINVPEKELLELGEIMIRECFEEQMKLGFRPLVRVGYHE